LQTDGDCKAAISPDNVRPDLIRIKYLDPDAIVSRESRQPPYILRPTPRSPLSDGKVEYSAGGFQETDIIQTSRSFMPLCLNYLLTGGTLFISRGRAFRPLNASRVLSIDIALFTQVAFASSLMFFRASSHAPPERIAR
jgi:hypothetical protein